MNFEEKIHDRQGVKCIYEEIINTPNSVIAIERCDFDQLFDCNEGDVEAIKISVDGASEKRMANLLERIKTKVSQHTKRLLLFIIAPEQELNMNEVYSLNDFLNWFDIDVDCIWGYSRDESSSDLKVAIIVQK